VVLARSITSSKGGDKCFQKDLLKGPRSVSHRRGDRPWQVDGVAVLRSGARGYFSLAGAKIRCEKTCERNPPHRRFSGIHDLRRGAIMEPSKPQQQKPRNNSAKSTRWSTTPPEISWHARRKLTPNAFKRRRRHRAERFPFTVRRFLASAGSLGKLGGNVLNIVTTYAAAKLWLGICCAVGLCESRRLGDDHFAGRGMGESITSG